MPKYLPPAEADRIIDGLFLQVEVAHKAVTCLYHAELHLAERLHVDMADIEAGFILRKLRYWESMEVEL